MWIYLSKTFEIYKGTQFWPPFLIRVCSCTRGSQLPSLLGGQAFVLWPRFENPSTALWRAEPVDVWKAVPWCFVWGQQHYLAAQRWAGVALAAQTPCYYRLAAHTCVGLTAVFPNVS